MGELFSELSTGTSALIRQEMELARHELTRSAQTYARNSALIGAGAAVAYAGAIVLLIGIAYVLANLGLGVELSFLIVGVITLVIGAFVAWRSLQSMRQVTPVPERTVETIKDDVEWAKEQTR
jgi:hypothetical protein